jgi:hypothetical protein
MHLLHMANQSQECASNDMLAELSCSFGADELFACINRASLLFLNSRLQFLGSIETKPALAYLMLLVIVGGVVSIYLGLLYPFSALFPPSRLLQRISTSQY